MTHCIVTALSQNNIKVGEGQRAPPPSPVLIMDRPGGPRGSTRRRESKSPEFEPVPLLPLAETQEAGGHSHSHFDKQLPAGEWEGAGPRHTVYTQERGSWTQAHRIHAGERELDPGTPYTHSANKFTLCLFYSTFTLFSTIGKPAGLKSVATQIYIYICICIYIYIYI